MQSPRGWLVAKVIPRPALKLKGDNTNALVTNSGEGLVC